MLVVCGAFLGHVLCKTLHADPMGDNQMGSLDAGRLPHVLVSQVTCQRVKSSSDTIIILRVLLSQLIDHRSVVRWNF